MKLIESEEYTKEKYIIFKNSGINPKKILDIGAHLGNWAARMKNVFPDSEILSLEGNPSCAPELRQKNPNSLIVLLGEKEGIKDFYLPADENTPEGGSFYKENTHYYNDYKTIQLPVRTLDSIAANKGFDFIKFDVQGAELDIIRGGLKTVLDSSMLQLEVSFLNCNQGAPLASEIISYLHSLGFSLYDIGSNFVTPKKGRLYQSDFFFINTRKVGHLLEMSEYA